MVTLPIYCSNAFIYVIPILVNGGRKEGKGERGKTTISVLYIE
jgi:hypothetical protein